MARKVDLTEAYSKAGRYCAFQERSIVEVKDKLKGWGLADFQVEEVLNRLIQEGFIDEQRFANAYCHDKFEFNSWGRIKIKNSLFPHQLDSQVVDKALQRIDEDKYYDRLRSLAEKKWTSLSVDEMNKKQKTVSYLAGKGFELDLAWEVVNILSSKQS